MRYCNQEVRELTNNKRRNIMVKRLKYELKDTLKGKRFPLNFHAVAESKAGFGNIAPSIIETSALRRLHYHAPLAARCRGQME